MLIYVNLASGLLAMLCASDEHTSTQDDVIGGQRRNRVPVQETLLVFVLERPDLHGSVSYGRDHVVPVQLFWVNSLGAVRRALLYKRGDHEKSLTFTAYSTTGAQVAPLLHRVQSKRLPWLHDITRIGSRLM